MKPNPNSWNKFFRSVITISGITLLLIATFQNPDNLDQIDTALLLSALIAAQLIFPLNLFTVEFSLVHWTVLGTGLFLDPMLVGWAALLGISLGLLTRHYLAEKFTIFHVHKKYSILYNGYLWASINTSLLIAFLFIRPEFALPGQANSSIQYWQSSLAISLMFILLHSVLFLIDLATYNKDRLSLSRREILTLASMEILPIPFVILLAQTYATIGRGAIILLGSIFISVEFLLNRNELTRRDLDRRERDLSTLNRVSQTLRSTLEMEQLLESIHTQVTNLLGVDNFYVALYDEEEGQIWYPLAVKHGQRHEWPRRPLTNRLTDRVVQEGKPILLGHHAGEAIAKIGLPAGEDAPFAWMGVPLITSNRTIGCLALFSLSKEVEFTRADINMLTILSGQTSVAIDNALLYQKVQHRAGHLESLVHDLRSPISAVVSAIDVIEDSASINEEDRLSKQALKIARRSAQRVLSMVESILDLSKFQSDTFQLDREPVGVKQLIAQTLEEFLMQANEFGVIIRDEVPEDLARIYADKGKIKRVITNLVDNALKYTPSGGQITISASQCDDMAMIRVSDTGQGIPEEHRQKIFERFSQIPGQPQRKQGYGLGLTYCRLAVEAHGGQIWVESRSGGGSTFNFTLPIVGKNWQT